MVTYIYFSQIILKQISASRSKEKKIYLHGVGYKFQGLRVKIPKQAEGN